MADRYWVGGTGTWDATSTTNWSDTSGGAAGFSAPTAADNVFFDSNSNVGTGAFTVTVSAALCNDFNAPGTSTALDGAMTLAMGSSTLTVSGSWTNQATNFSVTSTSGTITFNATTTGKTITTNGVTINASITLNGVGGAWTLGSALNISTFILTLTNGTFNTSASNYSVTALSFSSSNSNIRTINLNGSTVTLSSGSAAWTMTTSTNATLNAGTSTIISSGIGASFAGGGLTYYNVSYTFTTATGGVTTITGANTFNNLTFSTIATAGLNRFSFNGNQTINGTLTINGSNGNRRMFVFSSVIGTTRTLTCAAIAAMTDVDFRDITIAGAAGTLSGTRLGDCGGNSNITFVAGTNKYWNFAGGSNWNSTVWATSSGGGVADTNYPLPQDTAIIEDTGLNTSATISINGAWNIGTLDASTRTNAMTLSSSTNTPTFYGNFTYGSGVTPTGTGTYTFSNRATKTLNSGGKTFTQPVTIDAPGGGIQLLTNNLTLGSTLITTLTRGTLDLNNLTLTTGIFSSTNSNTRSIAFGSTGSIVTTTTTAGATVLDMATATGFTFTGTSNISAAMSTTRTFNFGSTAGATASNRLNINLTSGAIAPTFTGEFRQIDFTGSTLGFGAVTISCHGFTLASGGNYTLASFITVGTGTLTSNGKVISALFVSGSGITTTLQDALTCGVSNISQLTQGTLDLNGFTFTTGVFQSTNSNTRSIAFGSTGSIVLTTTSNTTVLLMSDARNFTFTGTSNISAAMSVNARAFSFGSTAGATTSNRLNINLTSGAFVPTFSGSFRQINFTGSTLNPGAVTISCHGFTLASGGTYTSTSFTTVGDGTLTYTGKSISTLNINTAGITTTLADAGQNATTTLTNGTLNLAGFTLTSTTTAATAAGTKNVTFNGGTLVCSAASATAWNNANPTGFTTTAGTGTGTISMTAATAKTFVGGSSGTTYNCTLNQGGAGTLTITGINIFNDITNTNATASQITFPASVTTFFNNFSLSGSAGNLVSLRSSTGGTRFTLSKSSGTVSVSYLNIQDSDATGGALWLSQTTSGNVDSGNNLGWIFGASYAASIAESATASDLIAALQFFAGLISESATATDSQTTRLDAVAFVDEGPAATITQSTFTLPTGTSFTGSTIFDSSSAVGCSVVANGTGSGSTGGFNAGGNYVLFNGSTGTRTLTTIPLDLTNVISVRYVSIVGTGTNGGNPPGGASADTYLDYNIGAGWVNFDVNNTTAPFFITWVTSLPLAARTASTLIRWRQISAVGTGDNFGFRTFEFYKTGGASASDTNSATLARVGAISETTRGSDTTIGRLTRIGSINEQAQGNDAISSRLICTSAVVEQVRGSDAIVLTLTRVGAISETARGSDSDLVTVAVSGTIDETSTASDTIDSQRDTFGIIDEQATAVDTLVVNASLQLFVNQTATITDSPLGNIIATLQISEGATILDAALARLLWELINDNQLPGWQLIPNNQGSGWTIINTQSGGSWTNIDTV